MAKVTVKATGEDLRQGVVDACKSMKNGPRVLRLYMEMCAKCGTCADQCPVVDCMILTPDRENDPLHHMWVDPLKCIGCKRCVTKGPEGILLHGCPWDAIEMLPTKTLEEEVGVFPY